MKQTGCQEYQKVLSYFYDLVKDGTLTWGSKLPTERKIAEQLGIGRNSAREAICVLHGMGVVERKQGSGNYVAENIGQSFGSMIQMLLLLNGVTKSEICEWYLLVRMRLPGSGRNLRRTQFLQPWSVWVPPLNMLCTSEILRWMLRQPAMQEWTVYW